LISSYKIPLSVDWSISYQLFPFLFLSISLHLLLHGVSLSCIPQHGQNMLSLYM
jgi:hypothetical protein